MPCHDPSRKAEAGFTLLEVGIAAGIATVGLLTLLRLSDTLLSQADPTRSVSSAPTYGMRQELVVEKLLQDVIEAVKAADGPTMTGVAGTAAAGSTLSVPVTGFAALPVLDARGAARSYLPTLTLVSLARRDDYQYQAATASMYFGIFEASVQMRLDATTTLPVPEARIRFSKLWLDPLKGPSHDLSSI